MKKHLNSQAVINELKGGSVFFRSEQENAEPKPKPTVSAAVAPVPQIPKVAPPQASKLAGTLAVEQDRLLEEIRKAVRVQGKEVAYVRLTQEEKNQLADIVYSYKRQGIRTSETEVSRIAINYLMEDYRANGKASFLAQLIERLNA